MLDWSFHFHFILCLFVKYVFIPIVLFLQYNQRQNLFSKITCFPSFVFRASISFFFSVCVCVCVFIMLALLWRSLAFTFVLCIRFFFNPQFDLLPTLLLDSVSLCSLYITVIYKICRLYLYSNIFFPSSRCTSLVLRYLIVLPRHAR